MKILIVSATRNEVVGITETLEQLNCLENNFFRGFAQHRLIDLQVTGVGAAATSESLAHRLFLSYYDLVLNVGICGSFKKELAPGALVNIVSEQWGDLGAEDNEDFLDLFDLDIQKRDENLFSGKKLVNPQSNYNKFFSNLPHVNGLTVNKAHGRKESIESCIKKYNPDVESMEGMAVFNVCLSRGINFLCLRSISNFVEPRNRPAWQVELALMNLTAEVKRIISVIEK